MSMKEYINFHETMSNTGSLVAKADIWNNLVMSNICFVSIKSQTGCFTVRSLLRQSLQGVSLKNGKIPNIKLSIQTFSGGIYYEIESELFHKASLTKACHICNKTHLLVHGVSATINTFAAFAFILHFSK